MTTRLDIALGALREIERNPIFCDQAFCSTAVLGDQSAATATEAIAKIDAAPPEIVLTREEAELCVRALDAAANVWIRSNVPDEVSEVTVSDRLQDRLIAALKAAVEETK